MRVLFVSFCSLVFTSGIYSQTNYPLSTSHSADYDRAKNQFASPPPESRLRCYWWWLNSMATKASITRDLEQMKLNGYGGASIVDAGSSDYSVALKTPAGPVFLSPKWMELYRHAIKEAQRLGIELSVNIQSGWNPGSPGITPELALKKIVFSETRVEGGKKVVINLPQPESKLLYKDILVEAIPEAPADTVIKDRAIKNWSIKSFNQSFGSKGTYPLYKLREENEGAESRKGIVPAQVINLTENWKNGTLTWDAPTGNWTIIRYGWTCTGVRTSTNSDGWSGLSLDHLDPEAFKKFSEEVIIPLITNAQAAGNSLHFLQSDSWEMGNVGWTAEFASQFKKFRGYDITPYLPVLAGRVVGTVDQSNRFLHDYRTTIGDCIAANHYKLLSALAHRYNLGIHPESGGPHSAPVDALKVMAISDFPQGEFWATANTHRIKDDERLSVKQSASVAHTNGKRYVAAEGPTSIGPQWERSPKDLKSNIDRIFCSGVNRIVWHTFTSSPQEFGKPGNEYFAGTHLNPNVTWWKQAPYFISYLNRCSYLLAQGLFTADVLYYYGDDVPNFVFLKEDVKDLAFGYDWDKCSKEALIDRVSVQNGRAYFPDGMNYRLLALPAETAINLEVLRKIETLVKAGLTVIGPRPVKATGLTGYPASDQEVQQIANRLWGAIDGTAIKENSVGKGKIVWGKEVNAVLQEMEVKPDFSFTSTQAKTSLDYIHRSTDDMEIYFVVNRFGRKEINDFEYHDMQTLPDRYEQVEAAFRVTGMVPEIWDPATGEVSEVVVYREENGRTFLPLSFMPEGSQFIVFKKANNNRHITKITRDRKEWFPGNKFAGEGTPFIHFTKSGEDAKATINAPGDYELTWSDKEVTRQVGKENIPRQAISGKWQIHFDTLWGGPSKVTTDSLISWTQFTEPGIKYYSGTAHYQKRFSVTSKQIDGNNTRLNLGNVNEMASITLNGHKLGVKWCVPFEWDITSYLKPGENQLEVEVVNLWANRLIGDSKQPAEKRFTKTNVKKFDTPDSEKLLGQSGLLGPVELKFEHYNLISPKKKMLSR